MTFLKVIRWKNLLMIAVVQALIHYHLMAVFQLDSNLTNLNFILLVLASILIAAGGYIINDINDLEADKINKPDRVWIPKLLTLKTAKYLYYIISLIGLILGFYVSIKMNNKQALIWFILPTVLLYLYAVWAKKVLVLGNVLVAFLIAFSLVLVVLFEGIDYNETSDVSITFSELIFGLITFAFMLNLLREIVKDAQDVIGDKLMGVNSIPVKYGEEVTHIVFRGIVGLLTGFMVAIAVNFYDTQTALVIYLVTAILVGLLLFLSQLKKVKKSSDYGALSKLLKLLMLAGIFSLFFIQYQT